MISISTYIITIMGMLVFVMVILLAKKKKYPETEEMKRIGWEIVEEIKKSQEEYLINIEQEKKQLVEQFKKNREQLEEIADKKVEKSSAKIEVKKEGKKIVDFQMIQGTKEDNIRKMNKEGYSIDDIVNNLGEYKGVVETIINLEKMKKKTAASN